MVFDFHNDLLTAKQHPKNFLDNVVYAVWSTRLKSPVKFIKSLPAIKYTAIEDLHFVNKENFSVLQMLKPVYASLTWNHQNQFAGGADCNSGITDSGKNLIRQLEESKILLDTAHLCPKSFFAAAEISSRPFICSHTCFAGIYAHRRNLSDQQLKTIIAHDGLVGLCLVPKFMGKRRASVVDVLRQIDYFTQKFGCNNLAIGTDFFGTDYPAIKNYGRFDKLARKLIKLGYKQDSIDKIFYKNALDFLGATNEQV